MRIAAVKRTARRSRPVIRRCRRLQRHAPAAGLETGRRPDARRRISFPAPTGAVGEQFERAQMHPFAEGVADLQKADDLFREGLDHRDLKPEAEIPHLGAERLAFTEQGFGPCGERMETLQQRSRRLVERKLLHRRARFLQHVERQVDAVEDLVVLAAILQVVVDLQRRAERVVGGPGRGALRRERRA